MSARAPPRNWMACRGSVGLCIFVGVFGKIAAGTSLPRGGGNIHSMGMHMSAHEFETHYINTGTCRYVSERPPCTASPQAFQLGAAPVVGVRSSQEFMEIKFCGIGRTYCKNYLCAHDLFPPRVDGQLGDFFVDPYSHGRSFPEGVARMARSLCPCGTISVKALFCCRAGVYFCKGGEPLRYHDQDKHRYFCSAYSATNRHTCKSYSSFIQIYQKMCGAGGWSFFWGLSVLPCRFLTTRTEKSDHILSHVWHGYGAREFAARSYNNLSLYPYGRRHGKLLTQQIHKSEDTGAMRLYADRVCCSTVRPVLPSLSPFCACAGAVLGRLAGNCASSDGVGYYCIRTDIQENQINIYKYVSTSYNIRTHPHLGECCFVRVSMFLPVWRHVGAHSNAVEGSIWCIPPAKAGHGNCCDAAGSGMDMQTGKSVPDRPVIVSSATSKKFIVSGSLGNSSPPVSCLVAPVWPRL